MNDFRKLMEALDTIEESQTAIFSDNIDGHLLQAAQAMAKEAVELSAEVFDEEGGGRTGITSREQYIVVSSKGFLDASVKQELVDAFEEYYKEAVEEEIENAENDSAGYSDDDDWKMDRTEPELDRQTDYNAPPRDDGYGYDY